MTTEIQVARISDVRTPDDKLSITVSPKTGAQRLHIMKQKDFIKLAKDANSKLSTNGAKREYEAYRVLNAEAFSDRIADLIHKRKVLVSSASVSKEGVLRGVTFLGARDQAATRTTALEAELIKLRPDMADVLAKAKAAVAAAKAEKAKNTTDVEATPVADTITAAATPAPASVNGEAVPASA